MLCVGVVCVWWLLCGVCVVVMCDNRHCCYAMYVVGVVGLCRCLMSLLLLRIEVFVWLLVGWSCCWLVLLPVVVVVVGWCRLLVVVCWLLFVGCR